MFRKETFELGSECSAIRGLFEYANRRKTEIGKDNVFDFSLGNPSAPTPAAVDAEAVRLIRLAPAENVHGYTSAAGDLGARKAVAECYRTEYGIPMSEEDVFMTCGASASLIIAFTALLERGEEIVTVAPCFPEYGVFAMGAGVKLTAVSAGEGFHLDVNAIERAMTEKTRAVLINSPNNPTGVVYREGELRALAELLKRKSAQFGAPVFLLSDEPYRELYYGDPPVCPMALYDKTVSLYSYSKSLSLAGERIGYIAISPRAEGRKELMASVAGAARLHGFVCAPALFQRVIAGIGGASACVSYYRANRDLLYRALSDMGYSCTVPDGAFYLFVKALEPDAKAFSERAKRYELMLVPSDSFGVEGYVRIAYCVPRETIERSLPAFSALMRSYRA